jgi:arginyl-tRNA synthetase
MSPLGKIKSEIVSLVAAVFPEAGFSASDIMPTPALTLGDLALPMFKAAKVAGKSPGAVAEEAREKIGSSPAVAETTVAGPYLNFKIDRAAFTKETLAQISKERSAYGNGKPTKKKMMVEFVSPNTNKPLHLGHLRNAAVGESLCRILEAAGNKVVRADLLNDRGVGITKAMVAYKRWGGNETPASTGTKSDHFVGDYYVMFEQKKAQHPDLDAEVAETLRKWEAGDKAARALWRTMTKWCVDGQNETVKMLGIKFDKVYRESALYEDGKKMVLAAAAKGVFAKDEKGNIVAKLPNQPDKVVLRADGTAVYITTDLVLTVKKIEENKLDDCLWVVGNEQDLHLRQLFGILRLLGYPWADRLEHISYGQVALPEGRMKSREGTVVDVDELVAHLSELAKTETSVRHDFLDPSEVDERAEEIALGAVKFYLLSVGAANGMVFNPKESLSFAGKTGPYVQYMNARINSILRKAGGSTGSGRTDLSVLGGDGEWKLVLLLAGFPDLVAAAASLRDPSLVAKYAYDLSKAFSEFYEKCPVLKAEPVLRRARLSLVRAVGATLYRAIQLLAIPAPKEM